MNQNGLSRAPQTGKQPEVVSILDALPTMIWQAGVDGRCNYFNASWLTFTGRSLKEEIGEGWLSGVHPEDQPVVHERYWEAYKRRQAFELEYRLRHHSGEYRWILDQGRPLYHDQGEFQGYLGTCFDLSERKKYEKDLRDREVLFKGLFEGAPDAVVATDHEGKIRLVNHQAQQLFGYTTDELIGQRIEVLMPQRFRSRHTKHVEGYQEDPRIRPMGAGLDLYGQRKNGEVFPADINLGPVELGDETLVLATIRDVTSRKRVEAELATYRKNLEKLVKQRTVELERSNQDLQDFAFIASHDMREPLRKVIAFGERLSQSYGEDLDERGQDYLERILDAATRMQSMLNALLTYSRVNTSSQPHEEVDLNETVNGVLSDLEVRLEETKGQVEKGALPVILAEPVQMHQLFQNLIGNALKFHHPDNAPVVKIWSTLIQEPQKQLEIYVEDNGIGFDEQYLDKIFQPFSRLHNRAEYEGSGIGLAVCRKIVERHDGTIQAHSTPGEGSLFTITLPGERLIGKSS